MRPQTSISNQRPSIYNSLYQIDDTRAEVDELDRYFNAEFLDVPLNLNQFWRANEQNFPKISKAARRILSIPASTAENERAFSRLRRIFSDERVLLTSDSITASCVGRSLINAEIVP